MRPMRAGCRAPWVCCGIPRVKSLWKGGQEREEPAPKWDGNDLELGGWRRSGVCPEFIKWLLIFFCFIIRQGRLPGGDEKMSWVRAREKGMWRWFWLWMHFWQKEGKLVELPVDAR